MDQILKFILNDSDADVDLGEDDEDNSDIDSEWEYEEESCVPEIDEFEPRREDRSEGILNSTPLIADQTDQYEPTGQNNMEIDTVTDTSFHLDIPQEETQSHGEIYPPAIRTTSPSSASSSSISISSYDESEIESESSVTDEPNLVQPKRVRTRGGQIQGRGRGAGIRRRGGERGRGGRGQRRQGRGARGRRNIRVRGGRAAVETVLSWKNIPQDNIEQLEDFPFAETEGLKLRLPEKPNCLDFVELYLTDEIMNMIVIETNRYADQYFLQNEDHLDNSYLSLWNPVTNAEMKAFFGLVLLMGVIYKPNIHMYWSLDIFYSTPLFSQVMARDKFFLILKFLHFNDNSTLDTTNENFDRLHKVRPLIDRLRERCRKVYYPGKELSVDESLVLYKGRLKFKQYIRTKRARFGIKLYEICTSNGITLDFMVYCGKGMYDDDDPHEELPYSERIPVVLMQPYMGNGHTLYTDNYYTSPALAVHLLKNKTHLCGTIRNNRKNFAKELIDAQLQKGEAAFYKCDNPNMIACKYRATKDKSTGKQKVVYMLSTCHQPFMEPGKP